jgi:hypothetical protein
MQFNHMCIALIIYKYIYIIYLCEYIYIYVCVCALLQGTSSVYVMCLIVEVRVHFRYFLIVHSVCFSQCVHA